MSGNGQWEKEVARHLAEISKSARQAGDALVEIGRMIKDYMGVDLAEIQRNTDRLNELARMMEQASVRPGMYVPDSDGKMKPIEWMDNLNTHFELLDPENSEFSNDQMTKDEFWDYMDRLGSMHLIQRVKPEPVKDANQMEIPNLVEQMFHPKDRVQVQDRTNENYLRVGKVKDIHEVSKRVRVRFPDTSEGVLMGVFEFGQLKILPDLPEDLVGPVRFPQVEPPLESNQQPHNNINDCVAAGCNGSCGRTD